MLLFLGMLGPLLPLLGPAITQPPPHIPEPGIRERGRCLALYWMQPIQWHCLISAFDLDPKPLEEALPLSFSDFILAVGRGLGSAGMLGGFFLIFLLT